MWTVDELMANHGGLRVRGGYNVKYEVEIRRATDEIMFERTKLAKLQSKTDVDPQYFDDNSKDQSSCRPVVVQFQALKD
ncbi:hypothetical protein ACI65C_006244 [Semiaphis heraclei]